MDDYCELLVQYPNGGKIWQMQGHKSSELDYEDIMAIANFMAQKGHEVKILHAIHYKDPLYLEVFGNLMNTKYARKCPDLLIDGEFVEYESYRTSLPKKAFRNMLHNGLSQSNNIILRECGLTDGYMTQQVLGQIQNGNSISKVWIFDGNCVRLLFDKY